MMEYLLIETRSLWESSDVAGFVSLARDLAAAGQHVDLFLIQNGVLMTREPPALSALEGEPSVTVWVDDVSLRFRGMAADQLAPGLRVADMKTMIQLMTRRDCKTVWH